MGLQDRDGEESVATEVCVRVVDARHGGQADQGQVWRSVERHFGWSVAGATRHYLAEAFAPGAGARRGSGRAMAQDGIPFFQAEDGIRDIPVTGVQTCAL